VSRKLLYIVRSFDPAIKGEKGDKGIVGIKGIVGPESPPSLYIAGINNDDSTLYLNNTAAWQTLLSQRKTVRAIGDPNSSVDEPGDVNMILGQYLLIARGTIRIGSIDAYVGARVLYDGNVISGSLKHVGLSDLTPQEAPPPLEGDFGFQLQALIDVTDLDHYVRLEFQNASWAHTSSGGAEQHHSMAVVYNVNTILIRANTILP